MLNIYHYIFYRLYKSGIRDGKGASWAAWSAFGQLCMFILLNIFGTVALIEVLTGRRLLETFLSSPKLLQYGVYVPLIILLVKT